jgi:hypothetical protein
MKQSGEQGLTSLVMPQKQQGKKGAAAGRVLVQVLASSDASEEPAAVAAAAAEEDQVPHVAEAAGAQPGQDCEAGFIMQEVASTRISANKGGSC